MGWDGMGMNTDVTLLSLPVLSRIQEKERTDSERNGKVKVAASFDATRSLAHGILRFSVVWKSPRLTAAVEREKARREGERQREGWAEVPPCRPRPQNRTAAKGQPTMHLQPYQTVTPSLMSGNFRNSPPDDGGGGGEIGEKGEGGERRRERAGGGCNKEPSTCCLMTHLACCYLRCGEWSRHPGRRGDAAAVAAAAAGRTDSSLAPVESTNEIEFRPGYIRSLSA